MPSALELDRYAIFVDAVCGCLEMYASIKLDRHA